MTGSAIQLDPNNTAGSCAAFTLKAGPNNTGIVYIGPAGVTTGNGYPLAAGDEFEYQRLFNSITPTLQLTPTNFYVIGTASDTLSWFATP